MVAFTGSLVPPPDNAQGPNYRSWMAAPTITHHEPVIWDAVKSYIGPGPVTDNNPIDIVHWANTGARVPSFFDDFYNRMLIEPADINAGNVSSDQVRTVKLFNGFFTPTTVNSILETGTAGLTLEGIAPPEIMGPLQSKILTLGISTEGPPDIDADYLFNFSQGGTLLLHVYGSRVIILPYQAEAGLEETLEWSTEVLTSNDGTEQRIRYRLKPRQTFSGTYHVPQREVGRAGNIIYGWLGKRWAIAVWSESQLVSFAASANIPCVTGNTDIRIGGLVMVWKSEQDYEIIEVAAINSGSIDLVRPTVNDYPRGMLMPVRSGVTPDTMRISKTVASARVIADFEVTDNIALTNVVPPQFLGEDIYFDEVLMGDGDRFEDEIRNRIERVDYGTTLQVFTPWAHAKIGRAVRYLFETRDESWAFRRWLHRRDGQQKPYWLPSFESDFILKMSGVVTNTLIVESCDWRGLNESHNHLAIELSNGTWYPCTITGSASINATTTSLAIDISLNVDAIYIRRLSLLGLKRIATNNVTIQWIGNAVGQCTLPILEIEP